MDLKFELRKICGKKNVDEIHDIIVDVIEIIRDSTELTNKTAEEKALIIMYVVSMYNKGIKIDNEIDILDFINNFESEYLVYKNNIINLACTEDELKLGFIWQRNTNTKELKE